MADLVQSGLTDGVVNDAKSLSVLFQLTEHAGPGHTTAGQLVGHSTLRGER